MSGKIAIKVIFSLITIGGVTGNILVCLVVLLNKSMRTPMNYLLVNLAVADTMLLVFFSPTFIFQDTFTHPGGTGGDILCALITGETLAWMGGYASSLFLLAISIERYIAVAKPRSYGASLITKNLKALVVCCWFFTIAWNSVGFAWKRYDRTKGYCTLVASLTSFKVYSILCFFVLGVFPMATMAALYSRVIHLLWFNKLSNTSNRETKLQNKRRRATQMVLIVTIIYALTWFPELTVLVLSAFSPDSFRGDIAYPATVLLCAFNSAINPVIYSFHSNKFRGHLKGLLCCFCSKSGLLEVDKSALSGNSNTPDSPGGKMNECIEMDKVSVSID